MKTLSIKQPWAGFILQGQKPVENRTWMSGYVGPMLIHAGKDFDKNVPEEIIVESEIFKMEIDEISAFRTGAVVGIVWKDTCFRACSRSGQKVTPSIWHDPGMVWWPMKHAAPLAEPIPAKGSLSLFDFEIDPQTPLRHSKAATIAEWLEVYAKGYSVPTAPPECGINLDGIREHSMDIYFATKKILEAARNFKPSRDPGGPELLEACRDAWRTVKRAESPS